MEILSIKDTNINFKAEIPVIFSIQRVLSLFVNFENENVEIFVHLFNGIVPTYFLVIIIRFPVILYTNYIMPCPSRSPRFFILTLLFEPLLAYLVVKPLKRAL